MDNPIRFIDPDGMGVDDPKNERSVGTKDITETFKYDNKGQTTGTDNITSSQSTYYTTTNKDGSVTESSVNVSTTVTVDRDGNISKDATQTVNTTSKTWAKDEDGNKYMVSGSYSDNTSTSKLSFNPDKDLQSAAKSVSDIKKETGLSPLQNLAKYQNDFKSGIGNINTTGGAVASIFSRLKFGPITTAVGLIAAWGPNSNPEQMQGTIRIPKQKK